LYNLQRNLELIEVFRLLPSRQIMERDLSFNKEESIYRA
jgi:hypothetical protein